MTGTIGGLKRRLASAALWGALAAIALLLISICIAGAIAFALLAFYFHLHLAIQLSSPIAAAATGGLALALAALIAAIGIVASRIAARPRRAAAGAKPDRVPSSATGSASLNAAVDEAASWISKNPRAAIIAAFASGSVFGFSPQLRKAVADLIVAAVRPPPPRP